MKEITPGLESHHPFWALVLQRGLYKPNLLACVSPWQPPQLYEEACQCSYITQMSITKAVVMNCLLLQRTWIVLGLITISILLTLQSKLLHLLFGCRIRYIIPFLHFFIMEVETILSCVGFIWVFLLVLLPLGVDPWLEFFPKQLCKCLPGVQQSWVAFEL